MHLKTTKNQIKLLHMKVVFPVHAMKAYGGTEVCLPSSLNYGTSWR